MKIIAKIKITKGELTTDQIRTNIHLLVLNEKESAVNVKILNK